MSISHLVKLLLLLTELFILHTRILLLFTNWLFIDTLFSFVFHLSIAIQNVVLDLSNGLVQIVQVPGRVLDLIIDICSVAYGLTVISIDQIAQSYSALHPLLTKCKVLPSVTLLIITVPTVLFIWRAMNAFLRIALHEPPRSVTAQFAPDDDLCSICQEHVLQRANLRKHRFATLQQCLHTFCEECIREWRLKGSRQDCPLCRKMSYRYQVHSRILINNEQKQRLFQDL